MQDFRDNEKKQLKMAASLPFWILFPQSLSWVIIVWYLTFSYIFMVQLIYNMFLNHANITRLLKFKMAWKCFLPKINQVMANIAEFICPIKKKSEKKLFPETSERAFLRWWP